MAADNKKKPFSVRLPEELRTKLEAHASGIGVPACDLVRNWIVSKLEQTSPSADSVCEGRELASIIIAALSPTIDLETAREIISSHLSSKGGSHD